MEPSFLDTTLRVRSSSHTDDFCSHQGK